MRFFCVLALLWVLVECPAVARGQETEEPLKLTEVRLGERTVRAGSFAVWENREAGSGKRIHLSVVVLPARSADAHPDPVFVFAGGPGQDVTTQARQWVSHWMGVERDIVLVSQRGTGGDNRLQCDTSGSGEDLQGYLQPLFQEQIFRDCLAQLEEHHDLTQYSTAAATDDVNDLRAALGYDTINLYGGSYGSRIELEYIRRHPTTVRTAILNSVAPVSFINPLFHASSAQEAVDRIIADCQADPDCAGAYGDLRTKFETVLERLGVEPAATEVIRRESGDAVPIRISRDDFADALRIVMYYDRSQAPYLIEQAFRGDFSHIATQGIATSRSLRESLAMGMLLCVTCAEDLDRISEEMIVRETAGTFLGDRRVRSQKAVCAFWPRSRLPQDAAEPVTADVPVLLLSGLYDPVTPPRFGEEAASHLPRSLHVVGPGSHGLSGSCIDEIVSEVLARGTVEGVDVSCVETLEPRPFRLPEPEVVGR